MSLCGGQHERRGAKQRYTLDQGRLGVTPRVADVDNEGNPAIVDDGLHERGVVSRATTCAGDLS